MKSITYGSVCSGIEAASVAWESLGWWPSWFSEIEPFPCAVLAERWPDVPNLGDMTKIASLVRAGVVAPEIVVGGTPCQAFSIAGLRNGLADERGQLTLSYVELANGIDEKRIQRGEDEAIYVWENVPGVLTSKDNAFGCFLAGLAGESSELQPAGRKWSNAGCVYGPQRTVAWRVLDAQFFRVAQRRKRVFVVASARKGFDPASILFESGSVRRDTPPRRKPQPPIATVTGKRTKSGSHWDHPENPHPTLNQSNNIGGIGQSNQEIFAQRGAGLVCDSFFTGAYSEVSRTLLAKAHDSMAEDLETYVVSGAGTFAVHGTQDPDTNYEVAHTVGRNYGQENTCIAFSYKDHGADATFDLSPTIRAGNHNKSHANSGQPPAVVISMAEPFTLAIRGRSNGSTVEIRNDGTANALLTPNGGRAGLGVGAIGWGMQVRRLMPVECERLQGFPDGHTRISWRKKNAEDCPDGPRYKAIGNSMAVPVMRWIGQRIAEAIQ